MGSKVTLSLVVFTIRNIDKNNPGTLIAHDIAVLKLKACDITVSGQEMGVLEDWSCATLQEGLSSTPASFLSGLYSSLSVSTVLAFIQSHLNLKPTATHTLQTSQEGSV